MGKNGLCIIKKEEVVDETEQEVVSPSGNSKKTGHFNLKASCCSRILSSIFARSLLSLNEIGVRIAQKNMVSKYLCVSSC